jgi:hypothetical protein
MARKARAELSYSQWLQLWGCENPCKQGNISIEILFYFVFTHNNMGTVPAHIHYLNMKKILFVEIPSQQTQHSPCPRTRQEPKTISVQKPTHESNMKGPIILPQLPKLKDQVGGVQAFHPSVMSTFVTKASSSKTSNTILHASTHAQMTN